MQRGKLVLFQRATSKCLGPTLSHLLRRANCPTPKPTRGTTVRVRCRVPGAGLYSVSARTLISQCHYLVWCEASWAPGPDTRG